MLPDTRKYFVPVQKISLSKFLSTGTAGHLQTVKDEVPYLLQQVYSVRYIEILLDRAILEDYSLCCCVRKAAPSFNLLNGGRSWQSSFTLSFFLSDNRVALPVLLIET
jgi:hypothetical protein